MQSRRRGRDSDSTGSLGVDKNSDEKAEKEPDETNLRERRLLVASPPSGRKRLLGARPFLGTGAKGIRGEDGGGRTSSRVGSAAVEDEKDEQVIDAGAHFLPVCGCDVEHDGATNAGREDDCCVGPDAEDKSVRTVAESFVDNVLDDLSSTASLSRLAEK